MRRELVIGLCLVGTMVAAPAARADIQVTSHGNNNVTNGVCSLSEALSIANRDHLWPDCGTAFPAPGVTTTIQLPSGTITLKNGNGYDDVAAGADVVLRGANPVDAGSTVIDAADQALTWMTVASTASIAISGITVENSTVQTMFAGQAGSNPAAGSAAPGGAAQDAEQPGANGGAILNKGTLTIDHAAFRDNRAGGGGAGGQGGTGGSSTATTGSGGTGGAGGAGSAGGSGGAIYNAGTLTVSSTAFSGNSAGDGGAGGLGGFGGVPSGTGGTGGANGPGGSGGAIANAANATATLTNVTFSGDAAGDAGGPGVGGYGGKGRGGIPQGAVTGTAGTGGTGGANAQTKSGGGGNGGAIDNAGTMTLDGVVISGAHAGDGSVGVGYEPQGGQGGDGAFTNGEKTPGGTGGAGGIGGPGNDGGDGGGVFNHGTLTIDGLTISASRAGAGGAGTHGGGGGPGGPDGGPNGSIFGRSGPGARGGRGGDGGDGGGISSTTSVDLVNATLSGNHAGDGGSGGFGGGSSPWGSSSVSGGGDGGAGGTGGAGGGVVLHSGALSSPHLGLLSSTVAGNQPGAAGPVGSAGGGSPAGAAGAAGTAGSTGGLHHAGVVRGGSPITITGTIVASNTGANCNAAVDGGGNLTFGDATCPGTVANPLLAALADNGGGVPTMALGSASPAIDAITASPTTCPATDARGLPRPAGACDIGAFERTPPTCTDVAVTTPFGATKAVALTCASPSGASLTYLAGRGKGVFGPSPAASPSHGTLSAVDQAGRAVSYTPDPDFSGVDSFSYSAVSGDGSSGLRTVTVTVSAKPIATPTPTPTPVPTPEPTPTDPASTPGPPEQPLDATSTVPPAATPSVPSPTPAAPAATPTSPTAAQIGAALGLPTPTACLSARTLVVHPKVHLRLGSVDTDLKGVTVTFNGRVVARLTKTKAVTVSLKGLKKGAYVLKISGKTAAGRTVVGTSTLHTCGAKR